MQAYIGDVSEDVIVSTTINWELQKEAEFIVREAVINEGEERGFTQGALVAMDVDGTVRALVGGIDYAKSQFNRAVTGRRQPGSAFKPFVYLAAMEKGYTPETVADDAPFDYNGWSPQNASGKYVGPVTLRDALAYSLNTVSARLAIDVGPQTVVDAAMRMGISSPMEAVPSIALGTSEVSLLELTAAYAPFANGGFGVIANVITRIETADGEVLYEADPVRSRPGHRPLCRRRDERHAADRARDRYRQARRSRRLADRRQDRHLAEGARRAVRRLHRAHGGRRLARQRRRHRHLALGRQCAGRDLEPVHAEGP